MDAQADSDEEFVVVSTSDDTETPSYPGAVLPQASGLKSNAKLFIKSIGFLPSLQGGRTQTWGTSEARTRKYSETKRGRNAAEQLVNNYYSSYHITGGFGGSGGEGFDKGGDGGTGQGPTVYFGQPKEQEPFEFRTIRLGDLKLVKEVCLSTESGVVVRQSQGVGVRRIHPAEIRGDPGTVTVAMYQGDGAEDEWRQDVAKYASIRHPNIMQLYGLVNARRLRGMVFHDEVIPYAHFVHRFEHSPILSAYILGYCTTGFWEATNYIDNVIGPSRDFGSLSVWIRPATGEFCLDLALGGPRTNIEFVWHPHVLRLENVSLDAPHSEDKIISGLSENQYHELCIDRSIARGRYFQVSTEHLVGPGIFQSDYQCGTCMRITEPLQILPEEPHWDDYTGEVPGELLPNSWTRYDSRRIFTLELKLQLLFPSYDIEMAWLALANHIFAELQELEHLEDYVCVDEVEFILRIVDEHHIPEGYLFVCPPQDFLTSTEPHAPLYQWLACPAYWSLDPSGADRLSTEDAKSFGFPAIHIETVVHGLSWDHSIYKGLWRFHKGKGFDPNSREVARQLGYPLYEVLSDPSPFPARDIELYSWCYSEDRELCRELGHYF
ncbi:Kinase-like protein [Mycena sanguinolenta]|uniref:Kinase-like protein n=1 Tax=Mycena sanguinolenta TaxID=230812 RepID=A0A8H6XA54_9AGAR|nr:Kinase-like protein [Mycena sanguinolenta]